MPFFSKTLPSTHDQIAEKDARRQESNIQRRRADEQDALEERLWNEQIANEAGSNYTPAKGYNNNNNHHNSNSGNGGGHNDGCENGHQRSPPFLVFSLLFLVFSLLFLVFSLLFLVFALPFGA